MEEAIDENATSPESNETIDKENHPFLTRLYVGQQIDVLDTVGRWSEAEILKIDKDKNRVFISYVFWSSKFDDWVNISSDKIAPLFTHTYCPPKPLKIGQRIEAMDTRFVWLEAFVIDENESEVKVHYKSWDIKFDEWIRRDSGRFRRFGPHRKNKGKPAKQWNVPVVSSTSASHNTQAAKASAARTRQITTISDMYSKYKAALAVEGLAIHSVEGDGNCLFRSVSHQIYGDDKYHDIVREKCMDYMEINSSFFSQFVVGGMECFHLYLAAKRTPGCWGDDPEIEAMCEIYGRSAMIYAHHPQLGARCLRTFHEAAAAASIASHTASSSSLSSSSSSSYSAAGSGAVAVGDRRRHRIQTTPMRLSYYGGGHYDSLVQMPSRNRSNQEDEAEEDDDQQLRHRLSNHSDPNMQNEVNLISVPPGVIEDEAIARARRVLEEASRSTHTVHGANFQRSEVDTLAASDREATERAALELAIEASRSDLTDWGDEDLEACLMLSVQDNKRRAPAADTNPSTTTRPHARDSSLSAAAVSSTLSESSMGMDDVLHSQEDLLRSAVSQSEEEFMQKALEDSLKQSSAQEEMESVLLESARLASLEQATSVTRQQQSLAIGSDGPTNDVELALHLSQLSDDELLQRALSESQRDATPSYTSHPPPRTVIRTDSDVANEEAQMQEALRLSMMADSMVGASADEIAAAELEAAIQASMRDL